MLAAQARERRGGRAEYSTGLVEVCVDQGLPKLLCRGIGSGGVFVAHQQQRQRYKRRITVIASMANLFIIESAVILGARMSQSIVMRMIRLNQNAPGQITASGSSGNLGDQLKGPFGGAKVRQSQSRID